MKGHNYLKQGSLREWLNFVIYFSAVNAKKDLFCANTLKLTISPFFSSLHAHRVDKKLLNASKDRIEAEWDLLVDMLLDTFQVACSAANPRVIENALEALLTLVEKNMVVGSVRSGKIGELLAKCYEVKDDSVHMTILITFGLLVAKPACELHEASLMAAIRIPYNIFLITSNSNIQKTAKEKLTEIFRTLFQRLHTASVNEASSSTGASSSVSRSTATVSTGDSRPSTPLRIAPASKALLKSPDASSSSLAAATVPETPEPSSSDDSSTSKSNKNSADNSDDETMDASQSEDKPDDANGTDSKENGAKSVGTESFTSDDASSNVPTSATPIPSVSSKTTDDVAFKDALQAFRGLCKLSVKAMPEAQSTNIHSFDIRSRILCLELLNNIFEEDNLATFRDNSRFVTLAIKKQLMDTIYINIPSPISLVFRLTLSLCVSLIREFRESLKGEIEGILGSLFLPILESPNAPTQHRLAVIRALYAIYKSPQCLADIFVNYDCEVHGKNIFEQLTKTVARAAQRKISDGLAPEVIDQENLIKHMALKISVCVSIALVEWSKGLYEHPADRKSRRDALAKAGGVDANSAAVSTPELEDFMKRKNYKSTMEEGKDLFKDSFKKGIRYFWEHGMCEKTYTSTARFLRRTPGLDKTMVGEFIGERYVFDNFDPLQNLPEYARLFDYAGMEVDIALRIYLGAFRLPAEGQKIERIMEAFAAKYQSDTSDSGLFANPDAVFYLSMAITMLTTSIHNPTVQAQDKLTLQSWKKLLLGQNGGKDYDDTMIDGIFARIYAEEFKVLGDDPVAAAAAAAAAAGTAPVLTEKQKTALFLQEAKAMSEKAKECVRERQQNALNLREQQQPSSSTAPPASDSGASTSTSTTPTPESGPSSSLHSSLVMSSDSMTSSERGLPLSAPTPTLPMPPAGPGNAPADSHPLLFIRALSPYTADYMVRAVGLSLLSTYMTAFETTNDLKTVAMCLEGIRGGIRLSCLFDLETERDAFVNAIAALTLLEHVPTKEIKAKHVEAILALLTVTDEEGNLGECWKRILSCISPLEKLLSAPTPTARPNAASNNSSNSAEDSGPSIDELNASTISTKVRSISIDRIFTNSSRLSDEAIVAFVAALCQVSKSELLAPTLMNQTRTFSLQKLGEVADFNIARPKSVWMTMWNSVSIHFTEAGLHRATHVALVAVDSLRQVASKLLERHTADPADGTTFQVALLTPFEAMYANPNNELRDYLICCLAKLMATHYKSVHSGWPAILAVIDKASSDTPALAELGMHQLEAIRSGYFDSLVKAEHFTTYVESISKYCSSAQLSEKIASQAIALLKFAAQQLATGTLPLPSLLVSLETEIPPAEVELVVPAAEAAANPEIIFTARPAHRGQWFPILRGLISTLEQHDINTRPVALHALFEILNTYGSLFSKRFFDSVFTDIIFPVLENVLKPTATHLVLEDTEWLLTTCHKFLHGSVVLFGNFFSKLGSDLLATTLDLLTAMTLQNNEKLATFGITTIETLLTSTTALYDSEMWALVIDALSNIMRQNMPPKLRVAEPAGIKSSVEISPPSSASNASNTSNATNAANAVTQNTKGSQQAAPTQQGSAPPLSRLRNVGASQASSVGLGRSTSNVVRRSVDPRKKILLGKAWIQNSALKMVRECLIDGTTPNERINTLEPRFVAQILDVYLDSFLYAYKVLRDPKLEDNMEQALYDLILKQEIDSMWTYTEVIFGLFLEHNSKSASDEVVSIVHSRILSTFAVLEQCHMAMAQQGATLSERARRLHESNEALVISFLTNFLAFPDDLFLSFLSQVFASFLRLTLSDSIKVRETVRDVMARLGMLKLGLSKESLATAYVPAVDLASAQTEDSIASPVDSPKASPRKMLKEEEQTIASVAQSTPAPTASNESSHPTPNAKVVITAPETETKTSTESKPAEAAVEVKTEVDKSSDAPAKSTEADKPQSHKPSSDDSGSANEQNSEKEAVTEEAETDKSGSTTDAVQEASPVVQDAETTSSSTSEPVQEITDIADASLASESASEE